MTLISESVPWHTVKLDHGNITKGKEKLVLRYFIRNKYIFVADISISPAILPRWQDVICSGPQLWSHKKLMSGTPFTQTNGAELHHVGQKMEMRLESEQEDWLDNERRASLSEDLPLRVDVLFLPVVHDVLLLDDLQCKCDVLVLHLHLQIEITGWDVTRYLEPISKQTQNSLVIAGKAQQTLTGRAKEPFISESSSHQFYSSKATDPESSDDLQVVEGPGWRERRHHFLQPDDVWW